MTIALRKSNVDQLDDTRKNAVSEIQPDLLLGDPEVMEDDQGRLWYTFSDSRWKPIQIAMLAAIGLNIDALQGYDSEYVDNETGEVTDRNALHEETKTVLQDSSFADPTMTLPENVTPSDPEADTPSHEDVCKAQEVNEGDLDEKMLVQPDMSNWSRVETQQ